MSRSGRSPAAEGRVTVGPDVALRRLRASDAMAVLTAFTSAPDMSRQGDAGTLEDAQRYVAHLCDTATAHGAWGIARDDVLQGLVCVTVDEGNRSGWFWYWMTNSSRGRGWTSRAAATVADWALSERGLERLELGHRVNNPVSGRVARAAGFLKEGTERGKFLVDGPRGDVDTYGRLRSDPSLPFASIPMVDVG